MGRLYPKPYVLWEPSDQRGTLGRMPIRDFPRITLAWGGMARMEEGSMGGPLTITLTLFGPSAILGVQEGMERGRDLGASYEWVVRGLG